MVVSLATLSHLAEDGRPVILLLTSALVLWVSSDENDRKMMPGKTHDWHYSGSFVMTMGLSHVALIVTWYSAFVKRTVDTVQASASCAVNLMMFFSDGL